MTSVPFDPDERAKQKQASRDDDVRALASGSKSREQLKRENSAFRPRWNLVEIAFK